MVSMQMSAALSGAYTINSLLSTSGTNFQSFTDFATAINAQGVSGPVTVSVSGGPFNEQVLFNQITGASSINRITINGNGCTITYASTNTNLRHTLGFNGGDYFTINNLIVQGTGTYAYPCQMYNNADYNNFNTCTFSVNITGTSSNEIPVVISGNAASYSTLGPGANWNVWNGCTIIGGYYGWSMYGNSSGLYTAGNQIVNSYVRDFYLYGIFYYYYSQDGLIANNVIECPNRTNTSTKAGIYCYGSCNTTIDGNWVKNLFNSGLQSSTGTCYGIYAGGNLESYYLGTNYPSSRPNTLKNNIVSDINFNGSLYAMYIYGWDGYSYHNTVNINNPSGNASGTTYGMYCYGYAGNYVLHQKNNIITLNRGGTGTKYGYYNASGQGVSSDLSFDYNDIYMNSSAGTQYYSYWTGTANNLAAIQTMGANLNGWSVDPLYTSSTDFHPTNTSINNAGTPVGVILDQLKAPRSGATPDIGALEFLSVNCSSTPSAGTVVTPTYMLCPGENAAMQLSNFSSDLGITYQWQSSTQSSVGIWTPIAGATSPLYVAQNVTVATWYQAVVTCTNTSQSASPVGYVQVVGTTTSTAPYYESFENIPFNNKLPNCSWSAENLGSLARTYIAATTNGRVPRTGSKFASFYYNPAGVRRMYTNGIWLDAGITYSASVWYTTEYYGYNNWTDLSIMLGTAQTSVGLQTIASTNGPAISNVYKPLSSTFTVPASGLYYVAIQASVTTASSAQYLSWDDLRIEIPCQVNSPSLTVSSNQSTVCVNQSAILQASGADTYTWSTGDNTSNINVTPFYAGIVSYTVSGTNSLTGCSVSQVQQLVVNPSPVVSAFAHPPVVCEGSSINLYATGATNYIWSNNSTGNAVTTVPGTIGTNTYVVVGTNQYNCQGSALAQVVVNAKPSITATYPLQICAGEQAVINASGGVSYQVLSGNSLNSTNPATVMPSASTQYTIYGTDANNCQNSTVIAISVDACTGIAANSSLFGLRVYPNPTNGNLNIELSSNALKNVEVVDVTGRVVFASGTNNSTIQVDLSQVAAGVYYVKVNSNADSEVIKVIKN